MKINELKCIKCGSDVAVKNGLVNGWQRYKCKACGYQYTKQSPQGVSIFIQILSSSLYLFGLSKREIARIVGVTPMTIVRWIKKYHIYYMSAIAPLEKRQVLNKKQILKMVSAYSNEDIMVITRTLPSGGRIDLLIQKGSDENNH